jgi:hypothetical protein
MSEHPSEPQPHRIHRHHKEHRAHRGPQTHAGGGRPISEESGLQLPQTRFAPYIGTFFTYPKGWKFNWLTPGRTAFLVAAGGFLIIVACMALAKLVAG